jgi:leucyl-tRNA synthetase
MTNDAEVPAFRYTAALANDIEARWQDRWRRDGTFHAPNPTGALAEPDHPRAGAEKMYVLDMFPYPSGAGLHVGHPLGYIGTDSFGRFQRMRGRNVLHTMGFDAFGLPAEQYAIQTGTHPRTTTEANIEEFRRQLRRLGLGYDERRSVATSDVAFYRWTQWIFLQLFNSWYDPDADRARPIESLVAAFADGTKEPAGGRRWADLSEVERRRIIDDHRLAYVAEAPVNWCPGLGTVLADAEVTADGRSERGNFPVFHRTMRQWLLRITVYADRLADDLDEVDWPEPIKLMQRNWIGRSTGAYIDFPTGAGALRVFTTRPDTVFGATYMVVAPEHPLVDALIAEPRPDGTAAAWPAGTPAAWTDGQPDPATAVAAYRAYASGKTDVERSADAKTKTGVFTGAFATNPASGARIPIFIADYVLIGYGTGAIMAVPGQDERDWAFAAAYELPIVRTVEPPVGFDGDAYPGEGPAINSSNPDVGLDLTGLPIADAKQRTIEWLVRMGSGSPTTTYRLRDWLFSRQRYWAEPFPIVYDETGLPIGLPETMLPVELPDVDDFAPKTYGVDDATSQPETPLSRATDWVNVELDLGDGRGPRPFRRETNVMPQWAGSCWYELRYLDPANDKAFVDADVERYWMGPRSPTDTGGVDLYVGGVEHAVLHLLYARFWHKVLFDLGHVSSREPFRRLYNQGYIQAYAYADPRGAWVPAEDVVERDGHYRYGDVEVTRHYGKMGKSLRNVVTPDEICDRYGADTFRVYEMSMGPLDVSRPWETRAIVGPYRFLQRVWRIAVDERTGAARVSDADAEGETTTLLHRTIAGVTADYAALRFNTAIAKLIELTNHVTAITAEQPPSRTVIEPLVLMLAPVAPHMAEELWERLGHNTTLAYETFPVADPRLLAVATVTLPVQVNGKVRARVEVPVDTDDAGVRAAALAAVENDLGGRSPRKVILVRGRVVSVVV